MLVKYMQFERSYWRLGDESSSSSYTTLHGF